MKVKRKVGIITGLTIIVGCILVACITGIPLYFLLNAPASYTWVMHSGNRLNDSFLVKMCPDGTRILEVQFGQSGAIGVDPLSGSVWAPELNDLERINEDQLVKIDPDGNIINRYHDYRTGIIAVDPNDGSVWVGLVNEHQVVKLDSYGEIIIRVYGFSAPASIAIDPFDSSIWVANRQPNASLVHLDSDGTELFRMETTGFFSNSAHQVAVDPVNGDVWFTGFHSGNVFKLSTKGRLIETIEGFDRPVSVSIHPSDGGVWIADFSMDTLGAVVRLDSDGEMIRSVVLGRPPHIAMVNPYDGSLWVGVDGAMLKLSDDGEILGRIPGFNEPESIAFFQSGDDLLTKIRHFFACH